MQTVTKINASKELIANDSVRISNSTDDWNVLLTKAFRDPLKLLESLALDSQEFLDQVDTESKFKMLVPLSYAAKMKKGDWNDPLLRQVLPLKSEKDDVKGFVSDPVGDLNAEISPGLLHKYQGRVLLLTTGACPVHCRYCFRREYPYSLSVPDKKHWQDTLNKIKNDESIHEVILSGGDPLMLSDQRLKKICQEIEKIPHIHTIRFHSRVPIFLPERITEECLNWLAGLKVNVVLVIHSNHKNEIDEKVGALLSQLSNGGITVLNQSVLLKGINDSANVLEELAQRLFRYKVLPYYLHQLDQVRGSAHFSVETSVGLSLIEDLKQRLSGYLVPKFVREVSGERSKQTIVKLDK